MLVEFTSHAERKIKQRNLKKAWVKETLKEPEYTFDSYSNRKIAYKKIGKLYLAVVFIREEQTNVVITARWEERFKPRIKQNN